MSFAVELSVALGAFAGVMAPLLWVAYRLSARLTRIEEAAQNRDAIISDIQSDVKNTAYIVGVELRPNSGQSLIDRVGRIERDVIAVKNRPCQNLSGVA